MVHFQEYKTYDGNILFAEDATQLLWNNWLSDSNPELAPISLYSHRSVDNAIENGNIYVANYSGNKILKLTKQRNKIKEIALNKPLFISCINLKTSEGIKEDGIWILDENGNLLKYNKNLELLVEIKGFSQKCFISSDFQGKCVIADNVSESIFVINTTGDIISSIFYSDFTPAINNQNYVLQIKFDLNSNIFVLTNKYLYKLEISEQFAIIVSKSYDLTQKFNLIFPTPQIADMDIDFFPSKNANNIYETSSSLSDENNYQDIYVVGGTADNGLILNFDQNCIFKRFKVISYEYPYAIKIAKNKNARHMGLLLDKNKFIEPLDGWESSSSSLSSSTIDYIEIFASSGLITNLFKFDTDYFDLEQLNNHIVIGSKSIAYNNNNNRIYYVSNITNEIYYYNFSLKTNVYISNAPSSNIDRITISPDKTKLWLSKDSFIWICDINTGAVLNTIGLKQFTLGPIEPYGGIKVHPSQTHFYLASGEAIYKGNTNEINTSNSIIYLQKIANKPVVSSYMTDLVFSPSGEMFITDDYINKSRMYMVNYTKNPVTYHLIKTFDYLIEGLTSKN